MTKAEFKALLEELAVAWGRRDYLAAASVFADDVQYADPLRYRLKSRAELQAFFENDDGYSQATVWHLIVFDEAQQSGAAEYTYQGTHRYHGTALIKVRDGKISHWREYQHIDDRAWEDYAGETVF